MIKIIVDKRELGAGVPKILDLAGVDIQLETLETGDYVVSDRVIFERKDIDDFWNSWLVEKKLLGQIADMAKAYVRPILIIEGGNPKYSGRKVHPNAIQGLLNAITIKFRVPILYADTPEDTANIIMLAAKGEQTDEKRPLALHGKRSHLSLDGQKEYVVSAVHDIGRKTACDLLTHFGSVRAVFNAEEEELIAIPGIKELTAAKIITLARGKYKP